MKELKAGVEQEEAKKMGYAEYNVYKKLRDTFRKKNKKSDEVLKKLKTIMKNGWEGKKTMEKLAAGDTSSSTQTSDHDDKKDEDDEKKEKKDKDKKKSSKDKKKK